MKTYNIKKKKLIFIVLGLVGIAFVVVYGIYFFGILFEFEYPYWLTLHKLANAQSTGGKNVSEIIKQVYPNTKIQWHTCSYCYDMLGPSEHIIHVQFGIPNDNPKLFYHFAYNKMTNELVPATIETAATFPGLMPIGDVFEKEPRFGLGDGTKGYLPENWVKKNLIKRSLKDKIGN